MDTVVRPNRASESAQRLLVLCGAPGSGKTTWAHASFDRRVVVSADSFRGLGSKVTGEDAWSFRATQVAHAAAVRQVETLLAAGDPVVVLDWTGSSRAMREEALEAGRRAGAAVELVVFDTPLAECLERVSQRDRQTPPDLVCRIWRNARRSAAEARREPFASVRPAGVLVHG